MNVHVKFDPPTYESVSFEVVDMALIEYVAIKGRPKIMSTDMADRVEVMEAVAAARRAGCDDLYLLHRISGYPTPAKRRPTYEQYRFWPSAMT